jgi:hypothetical protein
VTWSGPFSGSNRAARTRPSTLETFCGTLLAIEVVAELGRYAPGLTDVAMEKTVFPGTPSGRPSRRGRDESGARRPTEALRERGSIKGHVAETSLYTQAALHPLWAGFAILVRASIFAPCNARQSATPSGSCPVITDARSASSVYGRRKCLHRRSRLLTRLGGRVSPRGLILLGVQLLLGRYVGGRTVLLPRSGTGILCRIALGLSPRTERSMPDKHETYGRDRDRHHPLHCFLPAGLDGYNSN